MTTPEWRLGPYTARTVTEQDEFGTRLVGTGPTGPVTIRLLRADPAMVSRAAAARALLPRLRHPNLVPVLDVMTGPDSLAVVSPVVDGPPLRAFLADVGRLPIDRAALLVAGIAAGLAHLHALGLIHRHLTPEAVVLAQTPGGLTPQITDLGPALLARPGERGGGPWYRAPELLRGAPPTPAADIYACGRLLHDLLTGRPLLAGPFPAEGGRYREAPPERPSGIDDRAWAVLERSLAEEPVRRPDAVTLASDLVQLATQGAAASPDPVTRQTAATPAAAVHPPATALPPRSDRPRGSSGTPRATSVLPTLPEASATATPSPSARAASSASGARATARVRPSHESWEPTVEEEPWVDAPTHPSSLRRRVVQGVAMVTVAALCGVIGFWLGAASADSNGDPTATPTSSPSASADASASPTTQISYLSELPLVHVTNGWGPVELDRSVGELGVDDGSPITLGGTGYERGLGVHAPSHVRAYPNQTCISFRAVVGLDGEMNGGGSVVFQVYADGQLVYDSGLVLGTEAPRPVNLDITGVAVLDLVVTDGGDGPGQDHADWADALLECQA